MTRRFRWLGFAGLLALLAAVGCEKTEDPGTKPSLLCDSVQCTGESTCDEETGACVCGDGGLPCKGGTVCVLEPSPTCVSDRCEFTTCSNGQGCDPMDGLCKCAGVTCEDGEQCIQSSCVRSELCANVSCQPNETCDPVDGSCQCGDGPGCEFGERCDAGICKEDRCAGNPCGNGLTCNQDDGLCHCGDDSGPICSGGEACVSDEGGNRCEAIDPCGDADLRCGVGTTCDRTDGSCRCGGVGEGFPICASDQICDDGVCIGGELCLDADTRCKGGNTCDPEDGVCKCGGLFGNVCGGDQVCYSAAGGPPSCVQGCDPLKTATGCASGQGCYFKSLGPDEGQLFCAPAGSIPAASTCRGPTECSPGYHCDMGSSSQGKCAAFCNIADRPQCGGAGFCAPLESEGDVGFCILR